MAKTSKETPLENRLDKITALLQQLIAVQLYMGGATQRDIANNLNIAVGTVNKLVKGVKSPKDNE